MDKKITFEQALKTAFEVQQIMIAEFQSAEYPITAREVMSVFMLQKKWNGHAKLSDIKEDIKRHHSIDDFKKIEVMLAKTFTSLEENGFIKRSKCDEDKRETHICVTSEGKKLIEKFLKNAEKRWEEE